MKTFFFLNGEEEQIYSMDGPSLIIAEEGGKHVAYNSGRPDEVLTTFYDRGHTIAHIQVISKPEKEAGYENWFKMRLLLSRTLDARYIVTAAGYGFEGDVEINPRSANTPPGSIISTLDAAKKVIDGTEMFHLESKAVRLEDLDKSGEIKEHIKTESLNSPLFAYNEMRFFDKVIKGSEERVPPPDDVLEGHMIRLEGLDAVRFDDLLRSPQYTSLAVAAGLYDMMRFYAQEQRLC
jgi:hypothetical protein